MTDAEIEQVVARAVSQTLIQMGVDISTPLESQRDFQYLRSWRLSMEAMKRQSILTTMAIVMAGTLALLWTAFKSN